MTNVSDKDFFRPLKNDYIQSLMQQTYAVHYDLSNTEFDTIVNLFLIEPEGQAFSKLNSTVASRPPPLLRMLVPPSKLIYRMSYPPSLHSSGDLRYFGSVESQHVMVESQKGSRKIICGILCFQQDHDGRVFHIFWGYQTHAYDESQDQNSNASTHQPPPWCHLVPWNAVMGNTSSSAITSEATQEAFSSKALKLIKKLNKTSDAWDSFIYGHKKEVGVEAVVEEVAFLRRFAFELRLS